MERQDATRLEELEERLDRLEALLDSLGITLGQKARLRGSNWEVSEYQIAQWVPGTTLPLGDGSQYARFVNGGLEIRGGKFDLRASLNDTSEIRVGDTGTPGVDYNGMRLYTDGTTWAFETEKDGSLVFHLDEDELSIYGNVGIGIDCPTGPTSRLDVQAASGGDYVQRWLADDGTIIGTFYIGLSNEGRIEVKNGSSQDRALLSAVGDEGSISLMDSTNTKQIFLYAGGDSYFLSGNLGIGTSSPSDILHIVCPSGKGLTLAKADAQTQETTIFTIGHSKFQDQEFADGSPRRMLFMAGGSDFQVLNQAGSQYIARFTSSYIGLYLSGTEKMRLNATGLGVLTNAPTTGLDVDSDKIRIRTSKTPASAGAAGNPGDICWDSNYLYVCVATNTWKRVALNSW